MTVYRREAKTAKDIALILPIRGRVIVTAPPQCGKTTELLRYAEGRYPGGRFNVVIAKEEDREKLIGAHWYAANGITYVDRIAKRLLGQPIKGDDVSEPNIIVAGEKLYLPQNFTPVFADDWNCLPSAAQRAILKHRLFIAAVTSKGENEDAKEAEDR